MFLGHFAVGLAAKKVAPKTSLGTLFLAAQFLDILWPTFVLLGIERVAIAPGATVVTPLDFQYYPWSHSLVTSVGWGVGFGVVYWLLTRRPVSSLVVGALVPSHWLLDFIVHRPDLQLIPLSDHRFGLGGWNSLPFTLSIELGLFVIGVWLYLTATRAQNATGRWGLAGLLVVLVGLFAGNLFGPPPPSAAAVAWADQGQWLIVLWAYWVDRNRKPRRNSP